MIFLFLFPLVIYFAFGWIIFLLIKIRKLKFLVIPLILISMIPYFDIIFDIRFLIEDYLKQEKELVAQSYGPFAGCELNLRSDKTFEYSESSWYGTKTFKGGYTSKNDTIILQINDSIPLVYNHPISCTINKKEKKVEVKTDDNHIIIMDLIKNEKY